MKLKKKRKWNENLTQVINDKKKNLRNIYQQELQQMKLNIKGTEPNEREQYL